MTHRVLKFDYGTVHAFDTAYAACRFIGKTPGHLMVLARDKFFCIRNEAGELTIIMTATRCDANTVQLDAAWQIARHVEQEIAAEAAGKTVIEEAAPVSDAAWQSVRGEGTTANG